MPECPEVAASAAKTIAAERLPRPTFPRQARPRRAPPTRGRATLPDPRAGYSMWANCGALGWGVTRPWGWARCAEKRARRPRQGGGGGEGRSRFDALAPRNRPSALAPRHRGGDVCTARAHPRSLYGPGARYHSAQATRARASGCGRRCFLHRGPPPGEAAVAFPRGISHDDGGGSGGGGGPYGRRACPSGSQPVHTGPGGHRGGAVCSGVRPPSDGTCGRLWSGTDAGRACFEESGTVVFFVAWSPSTGGGGGGRDEASSSRSPDRCAAASRALAVLCEADGRFVTKGTHPWLAEGRAVVRAEPSWANKKCPSFRGPPTVARCQKRRCYGTASRRASGKTMSGEGECTHDFRRAPLFLPGDVRGVVPS